MTKVSQKDIREGHVETIQTSPSCKYCHSNIVIRFGKYKDTQYYFCKNCGRKFSNLRSIPKMHYPTSKIAHVLYMYYEGFSLNKIRHHFIQQYNEQISDSTIWNWVVRFTKSAIVSLNKLNNLKANLGDVWVAYETVKDIDGKRIWLRDVVDTKTLFLIASQASYTHSVKDVHQLMKQAFDRAGKIPKVIYTDNFKAYLEDLKPRFLKDVKSRQGKPYEVRRDVKITERFHWAVGLRLRVMRGLHTTKSARLFTNGWFVHHNFFISRPSLENKTPAELAGVKCAFGSWKEVCEQPNTNLPCLHGGGRSGRSGGRR